MAYQIPYHNLDIPLNPPVEPPPYSSLHLLYPGMPMIQNDVFDRYYVPHICPEQAWIAFNENKANTVEAACRQEILARQSSGNKVTIHAVEDPSAIVEDPALSQLTTHPPVALNDGMEFKAKKGHRERFTATETETKNKGVSILYVLCIIIALIFFISLVYFLVLMK